MDKSRLRFPAAGVLFIIASVFSLVYVIDNLSSGAFADTAFLLCFMALEILIGIALFCKSRKGFIITGVALFTALEIVYNAASYISYWEYIRYGYVSNLWSFFFTLFLNLTFCFACIFALIVVIGCRQRRWETGPDRKPSLARSVWWMPPWLMMLTSLGTFVINLSAAIPHFHMLPPAYFGWRVVNFAEIMISSMAWMLLCKWVAKPYKKLPPVPVQPYIPQPPHIPQPPVIPHP